MPGYCAVPGCSNKQGGHSFPKEKELRKKWIVLLKRAENTTKKFNLWKPGPKSVVCHVHFKLQDYKDIQGSRRRRLKRGVVPSLNLPERITTNSKPRKTKNSNPQPSAPIDPITSNIPIPSSSNNEVVVHVISDTNEVDNEVVVETLTPPTLSQPQSKTHSDKSVQVSTKSSDKSSKDSDSELPLRFDTIKNKPNRVKYFTSFSNSKHYMLFYQCLGPAKFELTPSFSSVAVIDQLLVTLVKLRQGIDDELLGILFGLPRTTVNRIFITWLNFLYYQLSELDIWPSKETVRSNMPESFGVAFPDTRCILDATEVPIEKPKEINDQRCTFSSYKNTNTLKTMVGVSPRGLVTYLSDSYGGSASDRQIIERSTLLSEDILESGDSLMADRGLMVQDLFANKEVLVRTPHMLRGKSQLSAKTVIDDRRLASKRIHVERIIGLGKTFKIIKFRLKGKSRDMGSKLTTVCYLITNFRESIVNRLA